MKAEVEVLEVSREHVGIHSISRLDSFVMSLWARVTRPVTSSVETLSETGTTKAVLHQRTALGVLSRHWFDGLE